MYHVSPYPLEGDTLRCSRAIHGVKKAIWGSPSEEQSVAHVCRSLRHRGAIKAAGYNLFVYRFPAGGSPQYAMFTRFHLPAAPGQYMYSTAAGGATLGADVPMVMGEWVCDISTVNVRAYFE